MKHKQKSLRQLAKDITRRISTYLEKPWWQGVAGFVGVVLVVLTVVIILQSTDCGKQPESSQPSLSEEQPALISITNMGIDNTLLDRLYGQALAFAMDDYDDAELSDLSIMVQPYSHVNEFIIFFRFYSEWADRVCCYASNDGKSVEPCSRGADLSADTDSERVTFKELPWIQDPDWPRFVDKSSQKVGPLPVSNMSSCHIWRSAYKNNWVALFIDGKSTKVYSLTWDGKGDPIQY